MVCANASKIGLEEYIKGQLLDQLDEIMLEIPVGEKIITGKDFNSHVGKGNNGMRGYIMDMVLVT